MTISTFIVNLTGWGSLGYMLFGLPGILAGPVMTLVSYLLFKRSRNAIEYLDNKSPRD